MKYEISELRELITNFVYEGNIWRPPQSDSGRETYLLLVPDSLSLPLSFFLFLEARIKDPVALKGII